MNTLNVDQVTRQIIDNSETMARNIWLAGLGLYSRSIEEAQKLNTKRNDLFEDLVERGREVELMGKERFGLAKERSSDYMGDQVNDALYRVSGIDRAKLEKLDEKIERLTDVVEALAAQQVQEQEPAKAEAEVKKEVKEEAK